MAKKKLRCCSFCGKSEDKIITMLQGVTGVYACNECIVAMYDALLDLEEDGMFDDLVSDIEVSTPSEIKKHLDDYVVGQDVFCNVSDFGNYECWNDMYMDDYDDLILPYCNYDTTPVEEKLINLSYVEVNGVKVDRDFRKFNVIENMLWCIENLNVSALEDYETSVFSMYGNTIKFDMPLELLVKLIKPDGVDNIYIDAIIDVESGIYLTDFDKEKVFEEDYNN